MEKILMSALSSAINGTEFKADLSNENLTELYKLANRHDLAHIVGYALHKSNLLPDNEIGKSFENSMFKAIFRYEKINYELNSVCKVLEEAQIPFIPLKGSVLRNYYPEPWMRTSCDIDIYVDKKNLDKASAVLCDKLEYKSNLYGPHDVSFITKSGMHIEIHYNLIDDFVLEKTNAILSDIWKYTVLKEKTAYQYLMNDEMFYFYHIVHMAKHFKNGGCGVRSFLDLFILNNKINGDKQKREALLLEGGVLKFSSVAEKTADVWFKNTEPDDTTKLMSDYIIGSGVYGSFANKIAVQNIGGKNKQSFSFNKLWKPYDELKYWYPNLEKHKFLLPFYEVKRWFKFIFGGDANTMLAERRLSANLEEETLNSTKKLYDILDIE